jgi:hypothetical protein
VGIAFPMSPYAFCYSVSSSADGRNEITRTIAHSRAGPFANTSTSSTDFETERCADQLGFVSTVFVTIAECCAVLVLVLAHALRAPW